MSCGVLICASGLLEFVVVDEDQHRLTRGCVRMGAPVSGLPRRWSRFEAKIASLQELKDAIRAMLDREDGTGVCGSFPPHIVQPPPRHKRTPMAENDSCSCGCAPSSSPW